MYRTTAPVFAPYFLSLGLFVGALLLSIVFPLVEPAIKPTGALGWFASKVSVLAIVGLLQALIAAGVVKFALGMETANTPMFILTAIITSYTFIALVQMCVSILVGRGTFCSHPSPDFAINDKCRDIPTRINSSTTSNFQHIIADDIFRPSIQSRHLNRQYVVPLDKQRYPHRIHGRNPGDYMWILCTTVQKEVFKRNSRSISKKPLLRGRNSGEGAFSLLQ